MRIIAGRFKGIRLPSPKGNTRPTADRVREAIFSSLGPAVEGARVLDLFAGTGAFGFEALSRGADYVVFVDSDIRAVQNIRKTAGDLGVTDQVKVLNLSAQNALKKLPESGAKFGIIFIDPPYETNLREKTMSDPAFKESMDSDCTVILERAFSAPCLQRWEFLRQIVSKRYGGTVIEFFVPVQPG